MFKVIISTGTDLWECTLWWLYSAAHWRNQATSKHHDPISCSVTLSWHWANQPLPSPNNAERWLGSDKYGFLSHWFEPKRFGFCDLPKREKDTLLIRPSRLISPKIIVALHCLWCWCVCNAVKQEKFILFNDASRPHWFSYHRLLDIKDIWSLWHISIEETYIRHIGYSFW